MKRIFLAFFLVAGVSLAENMSTMLAQGWQPVLVPPGKTLNDLVSSPYYDATNASLIAALTTNVVAANTTGALHTASISALSYTQGLLTAHAIAQTNINNSVAFGLSILTQGLVTATNTFVLTNDTRYLAALTNAAAFDLVGAAGAVASNLVSHTNLAAASGHAGGLGLTGAMISLAGGITNKAVGPSNFTNYNGEAWAINTSNGYSGIAANGGFFIKGWDTRTTIVSGGFIAPGGVPVTFMQLEPWGADNTGGWDLYCLNIYNSSPYKAISFFDDSSGGPLSGPYFYQGLRVAPGKGITLGGELKTNWGGVAWIDVTSKPTVWQGTATDDVARAYAEAANTTGALHTAQIASNASPYQPWTTTLTPPPSSGTNVLKLTDGAMPYLACTGAQTVAWIDGLANGWGTNGVNRQRLAIWKGAQSVTIQSNASVVWASAISLSATKTNHIAANITIGGGYTNVVLYPLVAQ